MEYINFKDLKNISRICFGTLALSNLQNNDSITNKLSVLNYAYENGINFYDTAELYDNYDIIGSFLKGKKRDSL